MNGETLKRLRELHTCILFWTPPRNMLHASGWVVSKGVHAYYQRIELKLILGHVEWIQRCWASCISSMLSQKCCVFMDAYEINRKIMRVKWGLALSGDGCVIKLAFLYFYPTPLFFYLRIYTVLDERDSLFVSCALARAKTRTITAWQMMWSAETQHIQNKLLFPRASSYSEGISWGKWQKETYERIF